MKINVLEYLEKSVRRFPDQTAVSDKIKQYSYRELHDKALTLGGEICRRTNVTNRPVAVFLPKGSDCIVAFMGILYSGNVYAPIDGKSPIERMRSIMTNLTPVLVVSSREHVPLLIDLGIPESNIILFEALSSEIATAQEMKELSLRRESIIDTDPVYILHTSGSTGTPKGVVISHRSVIDYISWAQDVFKVDSTNIIANQAPFHFDNSTLDIYMALMSGSELHIIPDEMFIFPKQLINYIRDRKITFLFWVPSIMVNAANMDALALGCCPNMRYVLFAGEVMPVKQMNVWRRAIPQAIFANLYGPTEITVDCTYFVVNRDFSDDEPLPIGIPCRNSGVLLLNNDNKECLINEVGELCVRGSSLAMGYWNQPEKTKEVFVQNPLNSYYPELIYRTGDLVYLNERREIMYVGRKDSQIKHMGVRIELGEIEQAILSIEGINSACVLYNNEEKQICLFYTGGNAMDAVAIRKNLIPRISKVMWPTVIHKLDALPQSASGKIDRQYLTTMLKIK